MKTTLRHSAECLAFIGLASVAVAGSSIGLGPSSGVDSQLDVPVIFSSTDDVVGVQFDLIYDPSEVSLIEEPFAGTSVGNHGVESEEIESGRTRVVVTSNTNEQLASGFLSIVPLKLSKAVTAGADSITLDNVILANGNGDSVSVGLAAFYGAYFGSMAGGGNAGEFALFVRPDQSAVFLAYIPSSDTGILDLRVSIDEDGKFSFTSDSGITVEGDINGSALACTVSPGGLTFSGTQSILLGDNLDQTGIYEAAVVNSSSGLAYSIIGADGRTYLYVSDSITADGGSGTVNLSGEGTITTSGGVAFSIDADADSSLFSGHFMIGDEERRIIGLLEGAERDDKLANISTRGQVQTGPRRMFAGFVISGTGTKQVLIRAIGPTLGDFGVPGTLENPLLELFRSGASTPDQTNDNWGSLDPDSITNTSSRLGAFQLGDGSEDSVLLLSLAPGGYTHRSAGWLKALASAWLRSTMETIRRSAI